MDTIIRQMAQAQGVTEALKAENQMEWVGKMNYIRDRAIELLNSDLIYT